MHRAFRVLLIAATLCSGQTADSQDGRDVLRGDSESVGRFVFSPVVPDAETLSACTTLEAIRRMLAVVPPDIKFQSTAAAANRRVLQLVWEINEPIVTRPPSPVRRRSDQ